MKVDSFAVWLALNTDFEVRPCNVYPKTNADFVLPSGLRVMIDDQCLLLRAYAIELRVLFENLNGSYASMGYCFVSEQKLPWKFREAFSVMKDLVLAYNARDSVEVNET